MVYVEIFLVALVLFFLFFYFFRAKDGLPTNWPFIAMLPALLKNAHRIHDFFIDVMEKSRMTFCLKGPWFTNFTAILTVDPANINYVFCRKFENYSKGPNYHEIFEVFGEGILNADDALWEYQRKLTHSFFTHPEFQPLLIDAIQDEMENGLFPLFDHVSKNAIEVDLQDVFIRFTLDNICTFLINHNPKFLSIDLPPMPFSKALADVEQVIFKRHLVPVIIWKSLMWLGFGEEKYQKDCATLDDFIYMLIAKKREERKSTITRLNNSKADIQVSYDLLTCIDEEHNTTTLINKTGDKFIRDTFLSLLVAGMNTTSIAFSWFFYLVSKYPKVSTKIRNELNTIITQNNETVDGFLRNFNQYNQKLIYLHAAICETLRLYPPATFNHKASLKSDILPSGHQVDPNMKIIFNLYTMGRMKSLWGDDCAEFKPERWITERGNIKPEPSYKFLIFGAGPRICQGKDIAFTQLKVVMACIMLKYDIEMVAGDEVAPEISLITYVKHGLKVKIKCREC